MACVGLKSKKFHIFNIDHKNEEAYLAERKNILDKYTANEILEKLLPLKKTIPRLNMVLNNSRMSIGDYLANATLAESCYNSSNLDLAAYTMDSTNGLLCCDINNCNGIGNCYDCLECSNLEFGKHCFFVTDSKFMTLCAHCFSCENCIGCINLKDKKFHILNKPYSEKEYLKMAPKIIKEIYANGAIQLTDYYSIK
ncbi:hypothetical protein KKG71_06795 [Patescibacteria group bacterium]|nr:hypothetical protein [Patescibacteria group bacterium]